MLKIPLANINQHAFAAVDHRAVADIGGSGGDAPQWAQRPFWRP
jgi:hypothetical protein